MKEDKPFLSVGLKDWIKTFWMFLISTAISIVGDAILQSVSTGEYSLSAIHWKEIGGAILVAVVSYIQKNFVTNSKDQFLKKEQI